MAVQLQPMEKSDIDQLRNRLHERINQLRQKRNAPGANATNPRSRDDILAARNKKKEDRKKAIKAQKEKGSKAPQEELIQIDKKVLQRLIVACQDKLIKSRLDKQYKQQTTFSRLY